MIQYSSSIEDLLDDKKEEGQDKTTGKELSETIKDIDLSKKEELAKSSAASAGLPYINLEGFAISQEALGLISEEEARQYKAVVFFFASQELRVATTHPKQPGQADFLKELADKHHVNLKLYFISETSFAKALELYTRLPKAREIESGVSIAPEELEKFTGQIKDFRQIAEGLKGASISDMIVIFIAGAINSRASDIHVEAEEKEVKIRYRIDGVLLEAATLEKNIWDKLAARLKLLARLKLNITNKPQDGRFTIYLAKEKIDVRVSALPTAFGESIAMRLLMSSRAGFSFKDLGLKSEALAELEKQIKRPNGLVLSTGPTGSGKTTTQYAVLTKLNDGKKKIVTIEDPVEYELAGINQSQVDASQNYTFAKGLRSIVRQDPDIVLVGEIRDKETADIAIQAALTGHLVLSTVHTTSSVGSISRLLSLEAKNFLLAPALNAVIGQRLVRKICEKCKQEASLPEEQLKKVKEILSPIAEKHKIDLENLKFWESQGCEECQNLKYKGRIGIFEIMVVDKTLEKLILAEKISEYDIQEAAVKNGMLTMVQDGLLKASEGLTTVEEVFRVSEEKR